MRSPPYTSKLAKAKTTMIQYGRAGVFQYKWEVLISTKTLLHTMFSHKALVPTTNAVKAHWFKST